jgi:hypothetical protein
MPSVAAASSPTRHKRRQVTGRRQQHKRGNCSGEILPLYKCYSNVTQAIHQHGNRKNPAQGNRQSIATHSLGRDGLHDNDNRMITSKLDAGARTGFIS